jgi:hypothetical protein
MIKLLQGDTGTLEYIFTYNDELTSLSSVIFNLYNSAASVVDTLTLGVDAKITESSTGTYEIVLETQELQIGSYYAELSGYYGGYKQLKREPMRLSFV